MAAARRILRHPVASATLSWLVAKYIRLVWRTGRWRVENEDIPKKLIAEGRPFIACFWHGRMLMIPNAWNYDARINILISQHRDGLFISRTLEYLGVGTISGSSSRGGGGALIGMVHALKRGEYVGITPDGPRGPRMRVAPGAAAAARLSGAVLLPVSYSAARRRVLSSWDRFVVPLPFSRGVVRIGSPIAVPRDADEAELERARRALESVLISLTNALDTELGVTQIEPAEETLRPDLAPAGNAK
jgi:lysophospholipid acyltransferase (LPLAT)-like uncharacterized protein